jgi:hypothetical protein
LILTARILAHDRLRGDVEHPPSSLENHADPPEIHLTSLCA